MLVRLRSHLEERYTGRAWSHSTTRSTWIVTANLNRKHACKKCSTITHLCIFCVFVQLRCACARLPSQSWRAMVGEAAVRPWMVRHLTVQIRLFWAYISCINWLGAKCAVIAILV